MCGIFGITNNPDASYLTYLGLHALQHRGEEAAGIVSADAKTCRRAVAGGLVDEGLTPGFLKNLSGDFAIGHVRYSTAGGSLERNSQPLTAFNTPLGELSIAHNGNIPGYPQLRRSFQKRGALFYTDSDSELLLVALVQELQKNLSDGEHLTPSSFAALIRRALSPIEGAYSLLFLTREFMVAVRDWWGVRPLVLGRLNSSWVVASETNAFDLIGARYEREVHPGEILVFPRKGSGFKTFELHPRHCGALRGRSPCIFELVYFARPDSAVFARDVYYARRQMGRSLAEEAPVVDANCVIAVPDSATVQALGYAKRLDLPFEVGLVRSHYIGRTFIAPDQSIRDFAVKLKLNPVRGLLNGKKVVLVDDSIVRGTTSRKIIRLIREIGGAKEVHMRIASPPIRWPCFYGIDMPTFQELAASKHTIEEIGRFLAVDSLKYLSLEGLLDACGGTKSAFCHACFTGQYKIAKKTVHISLQVRKNARMRA